MEFWSSSSAGQGLSSKSPDARAYSSLGTSCSIPVSKYSASCSSLVEGSLDFLYSQIPASMISLNQNLFSSTLVGSSTAEDTIFYYDGNSVQHVSKSYPCTLDTLNVAKATNILFHIFNLFFK